MKIEAKLSLLLVFAAIVTGAWFYAHRLHRANQPRLFLVPLLTNGTVIFVPTTNPPVSGPLVTRRKMSVSERLRWLENNGEVPEDADYADKDLSQKTSWWGKPLDPKEFWKNRPIWIDRSATDEAQRYGRWFPPIPTDDPRYTTEPRYAQISDKDKVIHSGGVEVAGFDFHENYRELVFWDRFSKTQPKPPGDLDREAEQAAGDFFNAQFEHELTGISVQVMQDQAKSLGNPLNYPPEEFTDNALFWTYVMKEREEYEQDIKHGLTTNDGIVKYFLQKLAVDPKLITAPLSADQLKAAKSWKVAYLQRLRREKADEEYIQAYLKAWNIDASELEGGS
jgi:hypothetical protein